MAILESLESGYYKMGRGVSAQLHQVNLEGDYMMKIICVYYIVIYIYIILYTCMA